MSEEGLVRELGNKIGYGNLMELASICWQDDMTKNGYPTSGVFVTALPSDVSQRAIRELENVCNRTDKGSILEEYLIARIEQLKQN